ncbi:MAG: hypothetical protein JNG86_15405, partial [Verrucomicrobiaceae bacterium]|nr:hypothetical protein [Verrucomicrobiaceae bacterium]
PWIKIETITPDKPEICAIATTLRMDADAVLGKLVRLWSWVEVNQVKSDDLGVTKDFLDKLVSRKGFAAAVMAAGWLQEKDGRLSLPNLHRHNGGQAKVRALTAQRVAVHRLRKQLKDTNGISEAPPPRVVRAKAKPAKVPVENPAEEAEVASEAPEVVESEAATPPVPETSLPEAPVEEMRANVPTPDRFEEDEGVVEEEKPSRKRRARAADDSEEQPMLF